MYILFFIFNKVIKIFKWNKNKLFLKKKIFNVKKKKK